MAFNFFAPPTKDDIKVGYIDPTLGYVDGVSVCEANDYGKNNPGTVFIFKDGDNNIRYLNMKEVNSLTPNDLVAKNDECGGIQEYRECGPPRIQFFGGGGIGAVGNPVIGRDGSILAVDVVSGGHGYQYPPIVAAKDDCENGNGVSLIAILGETADETEVFEGEEDFEEYEICEQNDIVYGVRYGLNGEELGPWEPTNYTKIGEDPIKREIELFQKAIQKPFWTTRKNQPDRITVLGEQYTTQNTTNVTYPAWGEFMNKYAVSPVKPSDTRGTDEAGKIFNIEWELNFPISGEYIFRGVCDNICKVYIDDSLVGDLRGFNDNPTPIQKTIQEGNHIIKAELLNAPITENVTTTTTTTTTETTKLKPKFVQQGTSVYFQVDGEGSGKISFNMDVDDNPFIAGIAAREVVIPSDSGNVRLKRDPLKQNERDSGNGNFTGGKKYGPIQIIGAGPGARGPIVNKPGVLGIRDADGDDLNIKITFDKGSVSSKSTSSTSVVSEVVSPKSWNENPMGVSMIIDAPNPPVPQEQVPPQTGRCPPNPIWTTRFPGSNQKWYPVRFQAWGSFMNRYAISPVLPLNTPGSDISGTTFSNSWQVDLPYAGFYGVKGTRDNNGRILIDGKEVSSLDGFTNNAPRVSKVYLTKGRHTITVEILNNPIETQSVIDTKVFSTQDWRSPASQTPPTEKSKLKPKFVQQGTSVYLQVEGNGSGEINFIMDVDDNPFFAGIAAREVVIPSDGGRVRLTRDPSKHHTSDRGSGNFSAGKKYGPIQIIGAGPGARGPIVNNSRVLGIRDADGDDLNIKVNIGNIKEADLPTPNTSTNASQSITKNGVSYSGPELFGYIDNRWSNYMNEFSVSPKVFGSISSPENPVVGSYTLTWKNVDFPYGGLYKFNFQADNNATLKIGGREILKTSDFVGQRVQYTFNITPGKYDVEIQLENTKSSITKRLEDDYIFSKNPMGVALFISKDVVFSDSSKTSWSQNPVGVSAILIPPPCAKKIGGKGVVNRVIVNDPGNGYLPPLEQGTGYPVTLVLDQVIVEDPGINYRCGEDQIQITPNNGAQLSYDCDSFGKIKSVKVLNPGYGFNVYPEITIPSETGVNAAFRPVFRVVRDPIELENRQDVLIQVTDLVGLKQTGYVNGRAYYGAIYYDEGIPYAGYYKTAGTQVRVYATLQESITAQVTTQPSAIQRSGTDIQSNDPRLNIPGTPQSTTEET
jgi:hypothetical protein